MDHEPCRNQKAGSDRKRSARRPWAAVLITFGVFAFSLSLAGCGGTPGATSTSAASTSVLETTTLQTTMEQTTLEQTTTTTQAAEVPSVKVVVTTDTKSLRNKGSVTFTYRIYNTGDLPLDVLNVQDERLSGLLDDAEAAWKAAGKTTPIEIEATDPESYFEFKHTENVTFPKGETEVTGTTTVFGEMADRNTTNAIGTVDWTVSREVTPSGPGQAEVVASLPSPIRCTINDSEGRWEWHYTITFVENNGVDATLDELGERFIDKDGQTWVNPQRGDLLIGDKQILIPAKWSNSYSNYAVGDFAGWTLEIFYGGTDKNGNDFSGRLSAEFAPSP